MASKSSASISSSSSSTSEYELKLIVSGESGIGKSTLLHSLVKGEFYHFLSTTAGSEIVGIIPRSINVDGRSIRVRIHLWDTPGGDRFAEIVSQYYRDAHLILLAYDLTKVNSLNVLHPFAKKVGQLCQSTCAVALIGMKADLDRERQVSREAADAKARELDQIIREEMHDTSLTISPFETSSHHVKECFLAIDQLVEKFVRAHPDGIQRLRGVDIVPTSSNNGSNSGCKC